ncbi:hypothetical protein C0J50_2183, partial [Silurus asotus]
MKVSRNKTGYMRVIEREGNGVVQLQGKEVEEFRYLGSTVQSNGECVSEVKKRVWAGWSGWKRVICDRRVSARVKGKVYNKFIRGTAHVGRFGDTVREERLRWFVHVQRRDMGYI